MGMTMGVNFENPMGMGMNMGMTFKNGYGCGYSYTRPTPIPTSKTNQGMIHKESSMRIRTLAVTSKALN